MHYKKTYQRPLHLLMLLLIACLVFGGFSAIAIPNNNFFGAVYTSMADGTVVNQNLYSNKDDVYLNGGPQNQNGNGLPNGTYYFQVTDPSGATLLSTDPAICRQVLVANGVIAGAAGPACQHANGAFNPANNSIPVQLKPYNDTPNNGGEYKVHLIRQTSSTSIAADGIAINFREADTKTDNFKVRQICTVNCNPVETTLAGRKFFDANADGQKQPDTTEPGLAGVQIMITIVTASGTTTMTTVATGPDGSWSYLNVPNGATYKVCEILPITCPTDPVGSYWVQTAPAPNSLGERCYTGVATGADITGLDFGNLSFAPATGGRTLGFWSNKNGQAIMKSNDNFAGALLFLRNLNLKDYNGNDFDPTNYNQFRTWLLNGNAVNMAYMLSVQLAATSLDVRFNLLKDSTIVDARSLGLGLVTIGALRTAANNELNAPGGNLTFTGNPLRDDQEILKNALDAINNNRLAAGSTAPLGVCYPIVPIVP